MKKLILISSTLFAFAFIVGCGQGKLTKDECDQDDKKMWDAEKEECVDKAEETAPEVQYTITNKHPRVITVSLGENPGIGLKQDQCVKVTTAQFATLKVTFRVYKNSKWETVNVCENPKAPATPAPATAATTAPEGQSADANKNKACAAITVGNYNINRSELLDRFTLASAPMNDAECTALGAQEEEPAQDANSDDSTASGNADSANSG